MIDKFFLSYYCKNQEKTYREPPENTLGIQCKLDMEGIRPSTAETSSKKSIRGSVESTNSIYTYKSMRTE